MAEWRYELQTNISEILTQMKDLQSRVDKLENGEHKIDLNIDSKKLERVITNLDKMLESLGKGTGDFKEFENLSKQLTNIISEVQTLNKSLGGVNDKGISNLLSSISNIDKTLSSLSEHIINVNKDFGKIGDEAGNNVGQINKVADATNELADATNKLNDAQKNAGNKSNSPVINPKNNVDEILKIDEVISKVSEHAKSLTGKDNLIFDNRLNKLKDIFKNQDILKEFNKYSLQTVNYDSLREMVNILNECKDNMLSIEDVSQRFSSIVSSQFTATIPEITKFDDTIFRMLETIKEFGASTNTYQSSGKDLFSWIKENGTDAQKTLFRVADSYEEFQRVLRGLSIGKEGIFNYSTSLNLDTLTFDISSIDNILSKENELENESNIAQKELSELRSILINTFNISPESDGTLTVTLKQLQEIIEQCPKAKQYIDEINSLISNKSNISSGQSNVNSTSTTSASAITEESNALKKVSSSATEAANAKEKFSEANKEVKSSADASTPSVEKEFNALDNVSKRSRSDADNVKLEQRARIYKELNSSLDRYAIVAGRVANEKTLSTDEEEMARLQIRIEELQNEPILSETQLELSRAKLEKIETSLENIQEKVQLNKLDSIQKSIDSYSKDYKRRNDGKPIEENRNKEYQQLLDKYKASIDALKAKKDELAKHPTISDADRESVRQMTNAIEENKNALIAMSAAEKGSTEGKRQKEIDKITKYLKDNTRISEEAKQKLKAYLDLLRSGDPSVNVEKIHTGFLKVTEAERLAGNEGKRFVDIIRDKAVYGLAAQIASYYLSIMDMVRYARNAINAVRELDTALIDLKKTTTMNDSELETFYYDANDVAKQMGVTTAEIINQASAWSRLGYSSKTAATEMAELSSQFASISPGMSTEDAQEGLVSIMKAWDIDVNQVEREVMDNINILGKIIAQTYSNVWCYLIVA